VAKTSMLAREKKRLDTSKKYLKRREAIKETMREAFVKQDFDAVLNAQVQLQKLPRDSNVNRVIKRCLQCGRPHAVYQRFKLCRICLRNHLMQGDVPGGRKASW
jgi:small subunit ribosomal protein S14